jgi:hypothetical protein
MAVSSDLSAQSDDSTNATLVDEIAAALWQAESQRRAERAPMGTYAWTRWEDACARTKLRYRHCARNVITTIAQLSTQVAPRASVSNRIHVEGRTDCALRAS